MDRNADLIARAHPTGSRVLVHLDPGLQETPNGIILPPDAQQITRHGLILAVGPDQYTVSPGDRILIELHAGTEVGWLKNTPVLLVEAKDIVAILSQPLEQ